MLEFKMVELEDKPWITELLAYSDFRGSEYNFGNNFVWRRIFRLKVARYKDFYIVKRGKDNDSEFIFPAGRGDAKEVIAVLSDYASEMGYPLRFASSSKTTAEMIAGLYGSKVKIEPIRDAFDYIYNAEDLATLKGKKYHSKRNHVNRFMENNWTIEPITAENIPECITMNEQWCIENLCKGEHVPEDEQDEEFKSKRDEFCVVKCSFKYFSELDYRGLLLRVDGSPQAFTFGEPLNSDTFIVHVEKALQEYQGSYAMINQSFSKQILDMGFKYINREEDTGAEGLRKAKLSYKPVFMEEKFRIEFNG